MADKEHVFLTYGDDLIALHQFRDDLINKIDPGFADFNLTLLDGLTAKEEDIRTAVSSLPFLGDKRVVLLRDMPARLSGEAAHKRFCQLLENVPESTTLGIVVEDRFEKDQRSGRKDWKKLPATNWLRKWAEKNPNFISVKLCKNPERRFMAEWIARRAKEHGGSIEPPAAQALAATIEPDTLLADQEILKLLISVDFQRPVDLDDVQSLVAQGGESDIFRMVDSLTRGDSKETLRQLHLLLEESDPAAIFSMVVRQFRLLIQAREALDEGVRPQQVGATLGMNPFVAEKIVPQAQHFNAAHLSQIYHQLLAVDEQVKLSQTTLELALDTLAAELSAVSGPVSRRAG